MNNRMWAIIGIVIIIGIGAFVYVDPLGLDLLGLKKTAVVEAPKPAHHPGTPPAQMAKAAAAAAVAQAQKTQMQAAASQPPTASQAPAAVPRESTKAAQPAAVPAPAAPAVSAVPAVAEPAQSILPPLKLAESMPLARKPSATARGRPKNQDLRYCLKLETDAAIAKCAGEN